MKKIISLCIIFITAILFYYAYDSLNYIHYSKIISLENGLSAGKTVYSFSFKDETEAFEAIQDMAVFASQNDIQFLSKSLIPNEEGTYLYHYYVQTSDDAWIYERIRLTGGTKLDLCDPTIKGYLSSDSGDTAALGTYAAYDNRYFRHENEVIRIMNISNADRIESSFSLYFQSTQQARKALQYLSFHYPDAVVQSHSGGGGGSDADIESTYQNKQILLTAFCSLLIIVMSLLCLIVKDKKEILILKMQGHSALSIVCRLYLKFLFFLFLLFCITLGLLACIVLPSFDVYFGELFDQMVRYTATAAIMLPLILVCSCIYIRQTTNLLELKNGESTQWMNRINFILKIAISTVILFPFITAFNKLIPNIQKLHYLHANKEKLTDLSTFSYFNGSSEELQGLYDQTIYFDMSDYATFSNFASYMFEGISLKDAYDQEESLPLLYVNTTYLLSRQLTFYDEQQQCIPINRFKGKTYLIPSAKKDLYKPNDGEIIYVKHTGRHYNLDASQALYTVNDPILIVYGQYKGMNIYPTSVMFPGMGRKEIDAMVEQTTQRPFLIHSMKANVSRSITFCENNIISSGTTIVMFGILYTLFIIQFCYLYIDNNRKMFAVSYLCGKTRIQRYGKLWLIDMLVYLSVILAAKVQLQVPFALSLKFTVLFFLFDSMVLLLFIRKTEKKYLIPTLRGGG